MVLQSGSEVVQIAQFLNAVIDPRQSEPERLRGLDEVAKLNDPGAVAVLRSLLIDLNPNIRNKAQGHLHSILKSEVLEQAAGCPDTELGKLILDILENPIPRLVVLNLGKLRQTSATPLVLKTMEVVTLGSDTELARVAHEYLRQMQARRN